MLIWRLLHTHYAPASCHIRHEQESEWSVIVYRGGELFMAESHDSSTRAWQRSTEIWEVMRDLGWNELRH